jgi:hypothetical protein
LRKWILPTELWFRDWHRLHAPKPPLARPPHTFLRGIRSFTIA